MTDKEKEGLKVFFDSTDINVSALVKKVGYKQYKKFDAVYQDIYK